MLAKVNRRGGSGVFRGFSREIAAQGESSPCTEEISNKADSDLGLIYSRIYLAFF